ncbi:hypothetical protein [Streptomyces sp. Rer75]|uniref:hypothetical protein n=1 Tax=unclassified Streptomyces TaxID=2593676 RepID=UPI00211F1233|nr:hypothetical protein [Streptomyces sp. Rer75]
MARSVEPRISRAYGLDCDPDALSPAEAARLGHPPQAKEPACPRSVHPNRAYDTGDGIHANIAGQQALADFVSLPMLSSSAAR